MRINFINHFKITIFSIVLIGFNAAKAGSYDDFFKSVKMDDAKAVQQLLSRGFDVNTIDTSGQNGLFIAIQEPSPKVSKVLVESPRIDLNALNIKGESPLMLAALKGQLELADRMVKKGADVNKTGWTPLHYAATAGQLQLIKLLIENHAYIDAESPNGSTPLMQASMYGTPEAVKLLLDEGADPTLKNQQGLTAVQFAQRASRPDAAELITKSIRAKRPPGQW